MAKPNRSRSVILLVLVVVAGAAGLWYYYTTKVDRQPEFTTVKVQRGDITQSVTATGDLQPVVTVDVGAQVSGQVQDVLVDFNSKVKLGDVLALIDPLPAQQRLKQAQADLESAKASSDLAGITAERTRELYKRNLVSQSDLDTAEAQFAQAKATLLTRTAALENAKLDVDHCTITSPIDGMVLNRATDKGRMVNSSMNAPVLFTLVNDLSKLQINAAVAEADIGSIVEGQEVTFTVDAFPNRTFRGTVFQVRNAATTNQSVVSYATIINVSNDDLKLKPGMTANVSIIIAQRNNVLRIGNAALRVRIPSELMPKAPEAPAQPGAPTKPAMTDQEARAARRAVFMEAGIQFGTPPTPDQIEKAKKIAQEKGLDGAEIERMLQRFAQGGGRGGAGGGFGRGPGAAGTITNRTVYKLVGTQPGDQKIVAATVRLGISDGVTTEVLGGIEDGDEIVTAVTMPGANPAFGAPSGPQNPFQQRGFGPGGFGGRGGR